MPSTWPLSAMIYHQLVSINVPHYFSMISSNTNFGSRSPKDFWNTCLRFAAMPLYIKYDKDRQFRLVILILKWSFQIIFMVGLFTFILFYGCKSFEYSHWRILQCWCLIYFYYANKLIMYVISMSWVCICMRRFEPGFQPTQPLCPAVHLPFLTILYI